VNSRYNNLKTEIKKFFFLKKLDIIDYKEIMFSSTKKWLKYLANYNNPKKKEVQNAH
jgi:hypothetical protein